MTIDEFLVRLEAVDRQWWGKSESPWIRTKTPKDSDTYCCPLTAVAGLTKVGDWKKAAEQLGLSIDDAKAIVAAADNRDGHDPALRARLLKACGLTEGQPHA